MEKSKQSRNKKIQMNETPKNVIINFKKTKQCEYDILPGYVKECNDIDVSYKSCCWNCCHDYTSVDCSIPIRYSESIFYIYGHFCSYNCAARYIVDNFKPQEKWKIYNLLNYMCNKMNNSTDIHIQPASNKFILKKFGGSVDIEEYRKDSDSNTYSFVIPPIIPVKHEFLTKDKYTNTTTNKHNFKLYRTKPLKKNNILSSMNL